jgi:hypothetical protein
VTGIPAPLNVVRTCSVASQSKDTPKAQPRLVSLAESPTISAKIPRAASARIAFCAAVIVPSAAMQYPFFVYATVITPLLLKYDGGGGSVPIFFYFVALRCAVLLTKQRA